MTDANGDSRARGGGARADLRRPRHARRRDRARQAGSALRWPRCSRTAAPASRLRTSTPSGSRASTRRLAERGGDARAFVVDVTDEGRVQALVDDVVDAEGGVDVVFANAGIASVPGFRVDGRADARHGRALGLGQGARRQPQRRHVHDAQRGARHEAAGLRPHHRHGVERRASSGAARLLRLRRQQGGGDPPRPPRRPRARAARRARQRDLPRPVLRDAGSAAA